MNNAAITVLMPVYNGEKYLKDAIESILHQTFRDFEFLIINDGSTDSSEEIILSYNDERINYVKNEQNIRLIATLNKGIELAKGKYIARMDADDISEPHRLQIQFHFMEEHPEVAICGSWFNFIEDSSHVVKYQPDHNSIMLKMFYQCHFCHPSVIWRNEVIKSFGNKLDPTFLHAEDYDFFVRVGEQYKLANIQQVLLHYRHHQHSVSIANVSTQTSNSLRVRKYIFGKLGLNANEQEIELFRKISQHEYENADTFISSAKSLLEKMTLANKETRFIENPFFNRALGEMWFHVCYNCTTAKGVTTYNSSFLADHYQLNLKQQIKLLFQPLLK